MEQPAGARLDALSLEALRTSIAMHGLFHETDRAATIEAVEKAIKSGLPAADEVPKIVAMGGGSGVLALLEPANLLSIFVSVWQSSVDDGGSTKVILDNFIQHGFGRGYSTGDLVSSLFKGFVDESMLCGILDDQGRILLATERDVEQGILPEFGIDGKRCKAGQIVVFGKDYGLPDPATGAKRIADVCYVDRLQQWAALSLERNQQRFSITDDDEYICFAKGLDNLLQRVQPYLDAGIVELSGASVRNLLLVAILDYLHLIDHANPRYPQGCNELLAQTDDEIVKYHYGLALLAEWAGVRHKAKVGVAHRKPATLYASFRDLVVTLDRGGDQLVLSIEPGVDGGPGKVHCHTPTAGASRISNQGEDTIVALAEDSIRVVFSAGADRLFKLCVGAGADADVIDVFERDHAGWVEWNGRQYPMSQDGTGLLRFPHDAEGAYRYQPLTCANDNKAYIRPRTIFRQTHVTETASYSPIITDGIAQADRNEKVTNDQIGQVEDVTLYRAAKDQRLAPNLQLLHEIESAATRVVTLGPGSLFTSIMPFFRIDGAVDALKKRRLRGDIPIKLILNPTIDNETFGYRMLDVIEQIERVAGADIGELVNEISLTRLDIDKLEQHFGQFETGAKWFIEQITDKPQLVDELGLDYVRLLECSYAKKMSLDQEVLDDDGSELAAGRSPVVRPTWAQYATAKLAQFYAAARQTLHPEIRANAAAASIAAKKSRGGFSPTLDEIRHIENSRNLTVVEEFVAGVAFSQSRIPGQAASPRVVFINDRTRFVLQDTLGLVRHSQIIERAIRQVGQLQSSPEAVAIKQVFMQQKAALCDAIRDSESPATVDYLDQLTATSLARLLTRNAATR